MLHSCASLSCMKEKLVSTQMHFRFSGFLFFVYTKSHSELLPILLFTTKNELYYLLGSKTVILYINHNDVI